MKSGAMLIDFSTVAPADSESIAAALEPGEPYQAVYFAIDREGWIPYLNMLPVERPAS